MTCAHGLVLFLFATLGAGFAASAQVAEKSDNTVMRDSQGNPVQLSSGDCFSLPDKNITDPECLPEEEPPFINTTTLPIDEIPPDILAELMGSKKSTVAEQQTPAVIKPEPPTQQQAVVTETLHFVTETPFPVNSAGLSDSMRRNMLSFLISLEPYFKVVSIAIVGHSDASGSAHYNQWLSEKRAESVRIYFRSLGVDPRMMTIRGAGETVLLSTLDPTAAVQRRVEIIAQVKAKP